MLQPAASDFESYILYREAGPSIDASLTPRQFEIHSLPRDVIHGNFILGKFCLERAPQTWAYEHTGCYLILGVMTSYLQYRFLHNRHFAFGRKETTHDRKDTKDIEFTCVHNAY